MGILSGSDDNIEYEKFDVGRGMKLIRIIDKETGVVLYTDTTRDGYTSVPISETTLKFDD